MLSGQRSWQSQHEALVQPLLMTAGSSPLAWALASWWVTALGRSLYKPDLSHTPPLCLSIIDCNILALLAGRNLCFFHQTVLLSPDFKGSRKFSLRLNIFRSCLKSFRSNLTSSLVYVSVKLLRCLGLKLRRCL